MTGRRILVSVALCVTLSLASTSSSSLLAAETTIFEYDSVYHHIRVVQDGTFRALRFDNNYYQSKVNTENPLTGHFGYVELFFEAFLFQPGAENVLMLGLGGGSAQRLFHHFQPGLDILTVELDPAVVNVAEEYFFYDRDVLPVQVSDARMYLRRVQDKWDLIVQDTYSSNFYGTFIPFHLATLEYFTLVKERLTDGGVFAINVIGTIYGGESNRVITSVYRTMHEVFPQIYLFAAKDSQNVVIVATLDEERLPHTELLGRAQALLRARGGEFPGSFVSGAHQFYDTIPSGLSQAIVLTDDFAPTDNLLR